MKNFLAIYTGNANAPAHRPDEAIIAQGMAVWEQWMKDHAEVVVVSGGPLGKTKKVDKSGVSDIHNAMAGFIVVQADSHEVAAKMFEGHPHFTIFPGTGVEVMECLPVPNKL